MTAELLASTPEPPYWAVIFSSRPAADRRGYAQMARRMRELAAGQPGFLGLESAGEEPGITVSYWQDEAALLAWKANAEHLAAQQLGRERWYAEYIVRVARVERAYAKAAAAGG